MDIDPVVDRPDFKWFRERPREGYRLNTPPFTGVDPPGGPSASRLGGFPYLPATEAWPSCSECGTPLFFLGQFGRDLPPLPLPEGVDLLAVYKCSNADCRCWAEESRGAEFCRLYSLAPATALQQPSAEWNGDTFYRPPGMEMDEGGWPRNEMVFYEVGMPYSLAVGERFTDFPNWEECSHWRDIEDPTFTDVYMNRYPASGAKLLGHPQWEQNPSYPVCRCGNRMEHLLQLRSPEVQLGDDGRLHILYCADWCSGPESVAIVWDCG